VSLSHWEDTVCPQSEDFHSEDGVSGGSQLCQAGQEGERVIEDPSAGTRYCTDLSAVLGMLRTESGRFTEFVGARVSEVKVNSNIEEEWLLLMGNRNSADLGGPDL
jgi:hypothetical protein